MFGVCITKKMRHCYLHTKYRYCPESLSWVKYRKFFGSNPLFLDKKWRFYDRRPKDSLSKTKSPGLIGDSYSGRIDTHFIMLANVAFDLRKPKTMAVFWLRLCINLVGFFNYRGVRFSIKSCSRDQLFALVSRIINGAY